MRIYKHNQKGVTAIGWVIILGLIAFFALMVLKLFPVYMEKFKLDNSLDYVAAQPEIAKQSKREILAMLIKNLDIQGVSRINERNFKEFGKIGYDKKKNKVIVMKYDIRNSLFSNLDIVMKYENTVVLKR